MDFSLNEELGRNECSHVGEKCSNKSNEGRRRARDIPRARAGVHAMTVVEVARREVDMTKNSLPQVCVPKQSFLGEVREGLKVVVIKKVSP